MAQSTRSQIDRLQKQYAENPGSRVFVYLAEAYRKAGELGRAHEVLSQGLEKHRNYLSGMVVLARVYGDQGEDAKAEAVWRDVVKLDPENVVALRALGDIAEASGHREEAMELYRRVVRLENAEPVAADADDAWETEALPAPFVPEPAASAWEDDSLTFSVTEEPVVVEPAGWSPESFHDLDAGAPAPWAGPAATEEDAEEEEYGVEAAAPVDDPEAVAEPVPAVEAEPVPEESEEEPAGFYAMEEATGLAEEEEEAPAPVAEAVDDEPEVLPGPEAEDEEEEEPAPEPAVARVEAPEPLAGYGSRPLRLWAAERMPDPVEGMDGGWGGAAALAEMLVRLLEKDGQVFQARSSLRRLLALGIGRELDLDATRLDALALASVLGSLGELRSGDGAQGARLDVTMQLLSGAALPGGVREAVAAQHERWDGTGPGGVREDDIPLLARVLAVASAAAARLAATPDVGAALDELQREAGSAFDPVLVSVVRRVFTHRELHGIGYGWGGRVAVVHPQELRALDLASHLHGNGYTVETAGTAQALKESLRRAAPQALVLGAELPDADAAALIREVRSVPALLALPVVVVDAVDPQRRVALLGAGADLCFGPEVDFPEFKASVDALLRRYEAALARARPARRLLPAQTADNA
ncbi:MAG TPA: HD domain-containing phosphohydrolase [Longimicrobiaceae bacterium]